MMKHGAFLTLLLTLSLVNCSSTQESFNVKIEAFEIDNAPGIQSYSWGKTSDEKWLILGGRTEGLHKRRPFESFESKENNKFVFVIDPVNNKTWSADLSTLPIPIFEQLQSTNQEFYQRDNSLYIIGGYGYSKTKRDHATYPNLTAIDVDKLAEAIVNKTEILSSFRQITYDNFAVTGGQLGLLNDVFYLCGGQYFEGRYNPMGPNHGPGFIQKYTNEVRAFEIKDNGTELSIINYSAKKDSINLHKRDYNMVPQIFPDNTKGFTMFSGVFQYEANLPWLNSVDVTETDYKVNDNFNQYLSQYHSAKLPIYDSKNNKMMTVFFGGLSQYQFNENNKLIRDDNVPFVKTISLVTRHKDGKMTEKSLGIKMPSFLGSGAEFIPVSDDQSFLKNDIVNLSALKSGNTLVGYIYGGIESYKENHFFSNNRTQSIASNKIFKVYIIKNNN